MWLTDIKRLVLSLTAWALILLSPAQGWSEAIVFKDKLNREVTIEVPCRKVVLFETYELLPITGAWDKVAALSRYAFQNDLLLEAKPNLGDTVANAGSAMDASLEFLLRLEPDLIITWPNENGDRLLDFWSRKGLTVVSVYPESVQELYDIMALHGKIFAAPEKIEKAIQEMESIFRLIKDKLADIQPQDQKTALWLFSQPNKVAGGQSLPQAVFDLVKIKNAAAEFPEKTLQLTLEKIIALNPEFLFIWGSSPYGPEELLNNQQWRHISAIKNKEVYKAPAWSTFSPRLAPLALMMAARAYPDQFEDVDVEEVINNFYLKVYGFKNEEKFL